MEEEVAARSRCDRALLRCQHEHDDAIRRQSDLQRLTASLTPWLTSATDNLASKTAVAVSGGAFTATLAATTVTTVVGK